MWKRHLITGVVFVSFLGAGGYLFFFSEISILNRIDIQSDSMADRAFLRLRDRLQKRLQSLNGKNLWRLNLDEIEKFVLEDQGVKDVTLLRKFPDTLKIYVDLQKPLLNYVSSTEKIVSVAEDARFMPKVASDEVIDLPILVGKIFSNNESLRKQAIAIINQLPEQGLFSKASVSQISYVLKQGFWLEILRSDHQVFVGNEFNSAKADQVNRVLKYLHSKEIRNRVIDASLEKKVVVRPRKGF